MQKKIKVKVKKRPLVISEFGGYSYRCNGHLYSEQNYGYKTYKTREDFVDAIRALYLGEVMNAVANGISALVYTQISDVEDETNGIITYDRKVLKIAPEEFSDISKVLFETAKQTLNTGE